MSHDEGHYLLHLYAILIQSFFFRSVNLAIPPAVLDTVDNRR